MYKLNSMKYMFLILAMAFAALLTGCDRAANVASHNLSVAADNFEVNRRIVFYNGITGEYMLTIEGLCNRDNSSTSDVLGVVCKVGTNSYKKHLLGLSDNVTFFMEQVDAIPTDIYHYRVIFKPSVIVPNIEIQ